MEASAGNDSDAVALEAIQEQHLTEDEIESLRLFFDLLACWNEEAQ